MTTTAPHARQILLVGPWRSGSAGGGCCAAGPEAIGCAHFPPPGALRDIGADTGDDPRHEHEQAAAVVLALRESADADTDVQLVDPRNTVYLLPEVYRRARAAGDGRTAAAVAAVRATTPWTLVVDGAVVSRGVPLDPPTAVRFCSRLEPR